MSDVIAELERLRALLPQVMQEDAAWARPRLDTARARHGRGQAVDRLVGEISARIDQSQMRLARRSALPITLTYPEQLPVSQQHDAILATLQQSQMVVLTGETGSGKTTQLPKLLLEAGCGRRGMIAVTQPRRVAAIAMSARIREETQAGDAVITHAVRFDDRTTDDTVVRVMTDGLLLAEAASDPDFMRYDAIMVDEAHERSLNIDLLLGLLVQARRRRPDLRIIISSASIAAERFAAYLSEADTREQEACPIISVSGRTFPVEIRYQPPGDDDIGYLGAALSAIHAIHDARESGDILCFLPTERDILEARRRLQDVPGLVVLPLFGRLTPHEQQRVFAPSPMRKVVLATNIAETSLTIPGIQFVIDTGLARLKRYQATTRTERLPIEAVSQASCLQRAGRAGRVAAGTCIRLYREEDFSLREQFTPPEVLRSNLAGVLLTCLAMRLGDPRAFPWLDAPSAHAWDQARLLLDELGALQATKSGENDLQLSPLGRRLAAIPADPQVARILLAGIDEQVPHEACTIAAFLSIQDPRVRPVGQETKADSGHRRFVHEAGDLATVLNLWQAWELARTNSKRAKLCEESYLGLRRMREWADVRHQLWQSMRDLQRGKELAAHGHAHESLPLDRIHRAVLAGLLGNVLCYDKSERCYRGAGDRRLHVHPGSALRAGKDDVADGPRAKRPPAPPWLVACEVIETSRLFARMCAPIDPQWVIALAGDRMRRRYRDPHWHPGRKQVVCRETISWKGLALTDGRLVPYERVDPAAATRVFINQVLVGEPDDVERIDKAFPRIAANRRVLTRARGLRARLRDPSLDVDTATIEEWYVARFTSGGQAPAVVASSDALRRWIITHGAERIALRLSDCCDHKSAEDAEHLAPLSVTMGGKTLSLQYRFVPGDNDDGVTLELSEDDLAVLDPGHLERLVPAWLEDLIAAYLQQIPKEQRRRLIPLADTARELAATIAKLPLSHGVARPLAELVRTQLGQSIPPFVHDALPPWLRPRIVLRASDGTERYAGRDLAFIQNQAGVAADRLRVVRATWETDPTTEWPGECPSQVKEGGITAFPAVVRDRSASGGIAVRRTVFASSEAANAWHRDGVYAALEAACDGELSEFATAPAKSALTAQCERTFNLRLGVLRRAVAIAVFKSVVTGDVRTGDAFAHLLVEARQLFTREQGQIDHIIEHSADEVNRVRQRLRQGAKSLAMASTLRAVGTHLELLIAPGWWHRLPWTAWRRLPDYLAGMVRRIELASTQPQQAMRSSDRIAELLHRWQQVIPDDGRLLQALGLTDDVHALIAVREETILGMVSGGGSGTGFSEGRLRDGLSALGRRIDLATDANQRLRENLLAQRAAVLRQPASPRRDALLAEGDRLLRDFPSLGFAVDLVAERNVVQAWCERAAIG